MFDSFSVEVDQKERMMRWVRWTLVTLFAVLLFAGLYLGGHKL
jgi:hypothetical protein